MIILYLCYDFCTLNHNILLNSYGIGDVAMNIFSTYLTGKARYVDHNGVFFKALPTALGVPQGCKRCKNVGFFWGGEVSNSQ